VQSSKSTKGAGAAVARTIRFPKTLRERIAVDADRCGRSFEAQVIALLRHHYGEDVDIAPAPDAVLALARGSLAGMSAKERREVAHRLVVDDKT
jgi:predicted DNA-binding protein